jgi:hypothetical protein
MRPQAPSSKHQAPSSKHQAASTKHQAPSTKHQAPSTKHQAPSHSPNGYAEKQALLQTTVAVLISCLKQTD